MKHSVCGLLTFVILLFIPQIGTADSVSTGFSGGVSAVGTGLCAGSNCSTYNSSGQPAAGTIYTQGLFYTSIPASCTVNANCSTTNDSGLLLTATASSVIFTMPALGPLGGPIQNFGYDGVHAYTISAPGTIIYGNCGNSSASISVNFVVTLVPTSTGYLCAPSSAPIISGLISGQLVVAGPSNSITSSQQMSPTGAASSVVQGNTSGKIDPSWLPPQATTSTANALVQGNASGKIDSSWLGPTSGGGAWTLISTLTAASSPSLQFAGANWSSSYVTVKLICRGLIFGASPSAIYINVGTGSPVTWQTGSYATTGTYSNINAGATPLAWGTTSATDITDGFPGSATVPTTFDLSLDNVSSTTLFKMALFLISSSAGTNVYAAQGSGYWSGGVAPIVGLQVIPASGTITSGTCSLYGIAS